jgi:hypothetical protein
LALSHVTEIDGDLAVAFEESGNKGVEVGVGIHHVASVNCDEGFVVALAELGRESFECATLGFEAALESDGLGSLAQLEISKPILACGPHAFIWRPDHGKLEVQPQRWIGSGRGEI